MEVQKAKASFVRTIPLCPPDLTSWSAPWPIWKPPPWLKLKVNFDRSVFRESKLVGARVIVRNGEGSVVASMAVSFHLPFSELSWR